MSIPVTSISVHGSGETHTVDAQDDNYQSNTVAALHGEQDVEGKRVKCVPFSFIVEEGNQMSRLGLGSLSRTFCKIFITGGARTETLPSGVHSGMKQPKSREGRTLACNLVTRLASVKVTH
jgi:hypothetical protein